MTKYLTAIVVGFSCAPALSPVAAYAQASAPAATIGAYARKHQFSGTILVQHDGATMYHRSFGAADRAFNVPAANDTKYRIASITKAFTAVLVLQLYEQGKLDLNGTIKTYLPNYAGEGADRVTIHHLLRPTSGIQTFDTVTSFQSAIANGIKVYQTPYTGSPVRCTAGSFCNPRRCS